MELLNWSTNENVVHCPYNSAHIMPHKTLVLHLTKCPDKPKSSSNNFKNCAFNTLHIVPEHELEAHEENCLDRIQLDKVIYSSTNSERPNTIIEKDPIILNEESWDEPEETIDVCKQISERTNFMKPVYGLSKSKRKQLRAQLHTQCSNVDLSYREDISINNRQDASIGASGSLMKNVKQNDKQNKKANYQKEMK